MGVTLRDGNREYFYKQLDRFFPHLKEQYIKTYGKQYQLLSPHNEELMKLFHQTCEEHGIVHNNQELFAYLHEFEEKPKYEQLSLFDNW